SLSSLTSRLRPHPPPTRFPYTTLFRSPTGWIIVSLLAFFWMLKLNEPMTMPSQRCSKLLSMMIGHPLLRPALYVVKKGLRIAVRSEEHTSELQSRFDLVCRLLLEKNKI